MMIVMSGCNESENNNDDCDDVFTCVAVVASVAPVSHRALWTGGALGTLRTLRSNAKVDTHHVSGEPKQAGMDRNSRGLGLRVHITCQGESSRGTLGV